MVNIFSYRISDFILFSDKVYFRQFELYNQATGPYLHFIVLFLSALLLFALWKKPAWAGRMITLVLVAAWLWVAWAFHYQRYYQIHVVANWYALGFVIQAMLLGWYGGVKNRFRLIQQELTIYKVGVILVLFSLLIYPFLHLLAGRHWSGFEMFGLAPDPTALATAGVLLLCRGSFILFMVPLSWLVISYITLIVM